MDVYENVYPVFSFYDVFFVTIFGANIKIFDVTYTSPATLPGELLTQNYFLSKNIYFSVF